LVVSHKISDAVVALPLRAHERLVSISRTLQGLGVRVHVVPDLFALSFQNARLDGFGGIPLIALGQPGISGWRRFWKRLFDVTFGTLALVVLSPLMAAIAIAVRLDSPGPALYRQERIGENGRRFTMLKFRSMRADADPRPHMAHVARLIGDNLRPEQLGPEAGGTLKIQHDPRITRLGRFLRKASLDELPQLLNVLKGEMSLVGPRPPLPYELALYQDWHRRRLEVIPGITGLWQIEGRNRVSFDEMVRLDLQYIEQQSIWLDLKILAQTPLAVLAARGAG
ncbi:MAG: sugar transferase, partial [Anaerolineae bacterium]|nr:sugar transferase [Anaerolineae bacterium]